MYFRGMPAMKVASELKVPPCGVESVRPSVYPSVCPFVSPSFLPSFICFPPVPSSLSCFPLTPSPILLSSAPCSPL